MLEMIKSAMMKRTTKDTTVAIFTALRAWDRKLITLLSRSTLLTPGMVWIFATTSSAMAGSLILTEKV